MEGIKGALIFIMAIVCGFVFYPSCVFAVERPELHFDGRNWKIGYEAKQGGMEIVEYVLEGETVQNWTELVTWQYFHKMNEKTTLRELAQDIREARKRNSPGVMFKEYSASHNDSIYWWSIEDDPRFEDQTEIVRIILGRDGIHFVHYAIKKPRTFESHRLKWINLLRSVEILD